MAVSKEPASDSHALVLADRDGVIRMWNPGAERLFGYAETEAIGQTLDLIVPEHRREQHWAGFRSAMESGKTKLDQPAANLPILRRDGSVGHFPGRLIFLRDALGNAVGAMGIFATNDGIEDNGLPSVP